MTAGIRPPRRAPPLWHSATWVIVLLAVTLAMLPFRADLNEAHVTLAYLLVVQGASASGGRPLGLSIAAAAFLAFNWFFLPPYNTLVLQDPLNWLVLIAFLATSVLSANLLYMAQEEAELAGERAMEIDQLAALGAETLNAGRAEDALLAIVTVIQSMLYVDECSVFGAGEAEGVRLAAKITPPGVDSSTQQSLSLANWVIANGKPATEQVDGTTHVGADPFVMTRSTSSAPRARVVYRPLMVRDRTVGVLRIASNAGLSLTTTQIRVLDALGYYAALGLERVRLVAEGERAEALRESHKAKDAVLASVSHDLRTPLTTIKALAHEIAASGDERAAVIEEEADRLNKFVADFLDLSRIASGAAVSNIEVNVLEDLVGAAARQAAGSLTGRDLRVELGDDRGVMLGYFDFAQTLRALVNLLENAAKYSSPETPIDVIVREDGDTVRIDVADRGPGVPLAEQDRIFDTFYRPAGHSPDSGGVGLGLSIARGIANAQKGSLTYASREGGGSVFSLSVPSAKEGQERG